MKRSLSKLIFVPFLHLLLGQVIPLSFIYLDLNQLGLPWTFENALDIYKSQTIYTFSSIIFPVVFGLVHFLQLRTKSQKVFYQNILNQMNEHIVVYDSNQIPIYENEASKKSATRRKRSDILSQKTRNDIFEWSFIEDESTSHFLVNFKNDLENSTLILILKDVTELKKKEEFIKQQELIISRNSKLASLGEIAAGISHEINNPLAVIIGNVEIIECWLVGPQNEIRKCLDNINRMGNRISNIIKLMKNLSREDTSTQNEVIDMAAFMEDLKCLVNMSTQKFCVDMTLDISSFSGEYISGNPTQISQVLINLINNAVHAVESEEVKWIKINLVKDLDYLILQISNSGKKIPDNIKEKIFQPFFTTKDPGQGTGLGLSISKNIIEKHHGSLELDDKLENTTFVIKLPRLRNIKAA